MKFLALTMLIFLSQFTNGQTRPRVYTTFENVAVFDDFNYISNRWEQKSTSTESFIISEKIYSIQRIHDSYFSISLARDVPDLGDFELITSIEIPKTKTNKGASGGVVMKAQKTGNGALILEINAKRQYRFKLIKNGAIKTLFGDKNNGWIKSKNLRSKGVNEIRIATEGNEYDIFFNNKFERSLIETSFRKGRLGFYAGPRSTMIARLFIVKINGDLEEVQNPKKEDIEEPVEKDDTYTELVKVFKTKIDKQQAEIEQLTEDLNICKANLSIDTASASKVKVLNKQNKELNAEVDRLENELNTARKRLTYLESMKEDIESQPNGDLILNLTELLSREKEKNKKLSKENEQLRKEIGELRHRN